MQPSARLSAAIAILDGILAGAPAEAALLRWSRGSRFAGSGDRAAVRDLVFDALRRRDSLAVLGGAPDGRGLMIGHCRAQGIDPRTLFTGIGHAPAALTAAEAATPVPDNLPPDMPGWLLAQLRAALPGDADEIARLMRERAPVWLRVNMARTTPSEAQAALAAEGIATVPDGRLASALRVMENERRISASAAYREGLVELQDLSPQLALSRLEVAGAERALDYCAGGGGKSLALAAMGARVTAHDADAARMGDLPRRAARAGVRIDSAWPGGVRGEFDRVVADVPCSGSGTWRRTPDAKWRLTPGRLAELVRIQAAILDQAAAHVRPGGELDYMTCSLLRAENDDQIEAFLSRNRDFRLVERALWTPLTASDGFFLARLARVNPALTPRPQDGRDDTARSAHEG